MREKKISGSFEYKDSKKNIKEILFKNQLNVLYCYIKEKSRFSIIKMSVFQTPVYIR